MICDHSPGPWELEGLRHKWIVDKEGFIVAELFEKPDVSIIKNSLKTLYTLIRFAYELDGDIALDFGHYYTYVIRTIEEITGKKWDHIINIIENKPNEFYQLIEKMDT